MAWKSEWPTLSWKPSLAQPARCCIQQSVCYHGIFPVPRDLNWWLSSSVETIGKGPRGVNNEQEEPTEKEAHQSTVTIRRPVQFRAAFLNNATRLDFCEPIIFVPPTAPPAGKAQRGQVSWERVRSLRVEMKLEIQARLRSIRGVRVLQLLIRAQPTSGCSIEYRVVVGLRKLICRRISTGSSVPTYSNTTQSSP